MISPKEHQELSDILVKLKTEPSLTTMELKRILAILIKVVLD
jgi:hypothetical protein